MVKSEWTRRRLLRTGAITCAAASLSPATSWAKGKDVAYITPFGKIVAYAPDFIASAGGYFDTAGVNVEISQPTWSSSFSMRSFKAGIGSSSSSARN